MCGNGRLATSSHIPALSPGHIRNIPGLGLGITRCFAAVVGRRVRVSFITAIEISTRLIVAMYGRASARVRCRVRKNEDRYSHTGSAGLTPRESHYCASLGDDS